MFNSNYTIQCDAHKHFSLFAVLDEKGNLVQRTRVGHVPEALESFLSQFPEGTPVALETVGNGHIPAISGLVLDRQRYRKSGLHSAPGTRR